MSTDPDVLVIGGGNAALCAALMAREAGASVLLLEAAPREWRGGNSAHTRNLRCMHDAPQDVLVDAYPEEEFWQDLLKVTGGKTNEALARLVIRASSNCRDWMRRHGVHFQPALAGTLHVARTNAFFMGGGKALVNAYFRSAEALGVRVRYGSPVDRIEMHQGRFIAAHVKGERITAKACVLAAGGFRDTTRIAAGNPEMWRDICASNRDFILQALSAFKTRLDRFQQAVEENDQQSVYEMLTRAKSLKAAMPAKRKGYLPALWEMVVTVPDRPGVIASLTGVLAEAGINIYDIEILRVREGEDGTMRLSFAGEDERDRAFALLAEMGIDARKRQ